MTAPAQRRGLVGLLAAVGISTAGTRMSLLALPWFVLSTTGSPTLTGLIGAQPAAPPPEAGTLGYVDALREGFAFLRGDRLLLGIGAMVLITNLDEPAERDGELVTAAAR